MKTLTIGMVTSNLANLKKETMIITNLQPEVAVGVVLDHKSPEGRVEVNRNLKDKITNNMILIIKNLKAFKKPALSLEVEVEVEALQSPLPISMSLVGVAFLGVPHTTRYIVLVVVVGLLLNSHREAEVSRGTISMRQGPQKTGLNMIFMFNTSKSKSSKFQYLVIQQRVAPYLIRTIDIASMRTLKIRSFKIREA